jgi:hypothetical protein
MKKKIFKYLNNLFINVSLRKIYILARNVADVQRAIEKIFPLVYEFKKPRNPAEKEVQEEKKIVVDDPDSDNEFFFDPDENLEIEPPNKKQKMHDSSHLTKRYKGPVKKTPRRPLGKMNEHKEDRMYVSDGEFGDDPEEDF